jgi:hypothetical protein
MRIALIFSALAIASAFLVFAHIIVTPRAALLVTLVLGLIAGVGDYLIRRRS